MHTITISLNPPRGRFRDDGLRALESMSKGYHFISGPPGSGFPLLGRDRATDAAIIGAAGAMPSAGSKSAIFLEHPAHAGIQHAGHTPIADGPERTH